MSNKWADGHRLEYCAQCGKEIYVGNIVLDKESDDQTPFSSEDCMVKFEPDGVQDYCLGVEDVFARNALRHALPRGAPGRRHRGPLPEAAHAGQARQAGDQLMANYCEYPIFLEGEWLSRECGEPACTKFMGTWLCALHEEPGERRLKQAAEDEALDNLVDE